MCECKQMNMRVKNADDEINALGKDGRRVMSVINDRSSTVGSFKVLLLFGFKAEQKNRLSL